MQPGTRSSAARARIARLARGFAARHRATALTSAGAATVVATATALATVLTAASLPAAGAASAAGAVATARLRPASPARAAGPASDCGGSKGLLGSLTGILCPVTGNATGTVSNVFGGNGGGSDPSGVTGSGGYTGAGGDRGTGSSRSGHGSDSGAPARSERGGSAGDTASNGAASNDRTSRSQVTGTGRNHAGPAAGQASGAYAHAHTSPVPVLRAAGDPAQSAGPPDIRAPGIRAPGVTAPAFHGGRTTAPGKPATAHRTGSAAGIWQAGVGGTGGTSAGGTGAGGTSAGGTSAGGTSTGGTSTGGTGPAAVAAPGTAAVAAPGTAAVAAPRAHPAAPDPARQLRAELGLGQPAGLTGAGIPRAAGRIDALDSGRATAAASVSAKRRPTGTGALPAIAIIAAAAMATLAAVWLRRRPATGRHRRL